MSYLKIGTACDLVSILPSDSNNIKKEQLEKESHKICRLCLLESNGNYNLLTGSIKDMLELIVQLKLSICEYPAICNNCLVLLKRSYNFKASCLDIEDRIQTYCSLRNSKQVELKEVLKEDNNLVKILEDNAICRICLGIGNQNEYTKLGKYKEDPLKHMMEKCLSEIKLNTTRNPALCPGCLELLEEYFHFLMQCLATEEKINYYCEIKNIFNKIDLYSVYIFSVSMEDPALIYVNGESDKSDDNKVSSPRTEVLVKNEQMELGNSSVSKTPTLTSLSSESIDLTEAQPTEVVTLQVSKNKHGEEIITSDVSNMDDHDHVDEDDINCVTPMSEVLHVKYSEDISLDDINSTIEMPPDATEVDMPISDESTDVFDDSDSDPDYSSRKKKGHKCNQCSFRSKTKSGLKVHITTIHFKNKNDPELFKCKVPDCLFETSDRIQYKKHVQKHNTCYICGSSFAKKYLFKRHIATHKKLEKLQKQNIQKCNTTTFNFNGQLLKMFKCQYCPYQTRRRGNLNRHILTHKKTSEIKTYKCQNCNFETIQKENLFTHLQTHNVEVQMMKCFLCSFQPTSEEALKTHVESAHKNKSATVFN